MSQLDFVMGQIDSLRRIKRLCDSAIRLDVDNPMVRHANDVLASVGNCCAQMEIELREEMLLLNGLDHPARRI